MPDNNRFFYGYIIVTMSFLAMMLTLGLQGVFGIFFKPIITELGWTRAVTSGAFSLSVIISGLIGIVMGGLNDRFGPRIVVTLCGLFSAAGYLLMSQIQNIWQIYIFFGVMVGAGSNTYVPLLSTIARWFVQRRGMMTGIAFAGVGVGMLILPLVINQLISKYDWRIACLILSVIVLVVVVVTAQFMKRDPSQVRQVIYGGSNAEQEDLKLGTGDFTLKGAAHTKQFWMFLVVLVCYGFCFFAIQVHITPYLTDLGISAATAATILATIGGATIIGQLGLGSAGDKLGYKRAFLIGIVLVTLAVLVIILGKDMWAFILLAAFSFTIGAAIGPLAFGYIFDITGNYQLAFWVCAALAFIAVIMTILIRRPLVESALNP